MNKEVFEIIDRRIKYIWKEKIKEDYDNCYIYNEDTLKNDLYHHIRLECDELFQKNNIRIFTEYTGEPFNELHYRPDVIICEIDEDENCYWAKELIAVIEIKYKTRFMDYNTVRDDYDKLQEYINNGVDAHFYMATIWENEDEESLWIRKNAKWANEKVTELNASLVRNGEGKSQFYVHLHQNGRIK